ncbi:MAG: NPCBM/NEW2 domain-containing protein, partial [Pseudomonadota bacterium]|nr:NPCBM/NEW2 domain-containing protein [Pseudomonadota bacterium]
MKLTAMLAMFAAMPSFAAESQLDPLAPTARWTAYTAGRAQTPPMGWSSWNAFATDIDEDRIVGSAQALVASVTFRVYGDGKALATSRALQWGSAGQQLSVDV